MRLPGRLCQKLAMFWSCLKSQSLGGETSLPQAAIIWQNLLYLCFWLYLALFPIGYGWREVMPPLCLIFLCLYWRKAWPESALARLPLKWPFYCALFMLVCGVLFSGNRLASLMHAGTGLNKAFILPFIAMECALNFRQLQGIVWALVLACFWEGLDGVYQALHGLDFIMGYAPNNGRLTGSLGDYTVGNYLALCLVPASAVWFLLRRKMGAALSLLLFTALFWPALYLFMGASSRSGLLAISGAALLWGLLAQTKINWRMALLPLFFLVLFMLCQPGRLGLDSALNDNRWDLWHLAWEVFKAHPWFGAGAGQYNEAFRSLGLAPAREVISISHPHNLYLDMLYAHGLIGFAAGALFIGAFSLWGYRRIRSGLLLEKAAGQGLYWHISAFFWLGFMAWLINGVFGHDFYRSWWLAQAMIALGLMLGAIVNSPQEYPGPRQGQDRLKDKG